MVGDSTMRGMSTTAQAVIRWGYDLIFNSGSCRRLVVTSCKPIPERPLGHPGHPRHGRHRDHDGVQRLEGRRRRRGDHGGGSRQGVSYVDVAHIPHRHRRGGSEAHRHLPGVPGAQPGAGRQGTAAPHAEGARLGRLQRRPRRLVPRGTASTWPTPAGSPSPTCSRPRSTGCRSGGASPTAATGTPTAAPTGLPPSSAAPAGLSTGPEQRLLDTRADDADAVAAPLGAGSFLRLGLTASSVVAAGTTSVLVNLAAVDPCGFGFLTAYPCPRRRWLPT